MWLSLQWHSICDLFCVIFFLMDFLPGDLSVLGDRPFGRSFPSNLSHRPQQNVLIRSKAQWFVLCYSNYRCGLLTFLTILLCDFLYEQRNVIFSGPKRASNISVSPYLRISHNLHYHHLNSIGKVENLHFQLRNLKKFTKFLLQLFKKMF